MSGERQDIKFKRRKTGHVIPSYKLKLIDTLIECGVLKFGEFILKSKRESPYFLNFGELNSGKSTAILADSFAHLIIEHLGKKSKQIYLYGVPEKGVALAPTVSISIMKKYGIDTNWFFTRKAEKEYGEATNLQKKDSIKRIIVGSVPPRNSTVFMIDDVLTRGTGKLDELKILKKYNIRVAALFIAVDRQEVRIDGKNGVLEFTKNTGIPVYSILKTEEILEYLRRSENDYSSHGVVNNKDFFKKMSAYLQVYGTDEIKSTLITSPNQDIIRGSIIPSCDRLTLHNFDELVRQTSTLKMVGGYKIGFELALKYGLPKVVRIARKYTRKMLIYDHQKGGTDVPYTGQEFMRTVKTAGVDAVILFPQAGPETARAWIYRAYTEGLRVIVGGLMTHPAYTVSEGGFIDDKNALDIYRIAAKAGVTDFVVPGTKVDAIKLVNGILSKEHIKPIFYVTGFGRQEAVISQINNILHKNWHPIVGSAIYGAEKEHYYIATKAVITQFDRGESRV